MITSIKVSPGEGDNLSSYVEFCIDIAKAGSAPVDVEYNGQSFVVEPSHVQQIIKVLYRETAAKKREHESDQTT